MRVRVSRKWIAGHVSSVCQQPNSYSVRTLDGREFRRTRKAINAVRPGASFGNSPPGNLPGQTEAEQFWPAPRQEPTPQPVPEVCGTTSPGPVNPVNRSAESIASPAHCASPRAPASQETGGGGVTRSGKRYWAPSRQLNLESSEVDT